MKLWDLITGSRPAPKGVRAVTAATLRKRLIGLNRETAPWQVRGGEKQRVDLIAEWKIVDAQWYEVFAKAGVKRIFKVLMKFDEAKHEVRAVDQAWSIAWSVGGHPILSAEAEGFRGQQWEMSFETVHAFREDLSYGEIYSYRFNSEEIKEPLRKAVAAAGWSWRGVAFGKL